MFADRVLDRCRCAVGSVNGQAAPFLQSRQGGHNRRFCPVLAGNPIEVRTTCGRSRQPAATPQRRALPPPGRPRLAARTAGHDRRGRRRLAGGDARRTTAPAGDRRVDVRRGHRRPGRPRDLPPLVRTRRRRTRGHRGTPGLAHASRGRHLPEPARRRRQRRPGHSQGPGSPTRGPTPHPAASPPGYNAIPSRTTPTRPCSRGTITLCAGSRRHATQKTPPC